MTRVHHPHLFTDGGGRQLLGDMSMGLWGVLGLEIIVALVIDELARSGGDGGALQKDKEKSIKLCHGNSRSLSYLYI